MLQLAALLSVEPAWCLVRELIDYRAPTQASSPSESSRDLRVNRQQRLGEQTENTHALPFRIGSV